MNNIILCSAAILALVSCGTEQKKTNNDVGGSSRETAVLVSNVSGKFIIDTVSTVIKWKGTKLAGDHYGFVSVSSGAVFVENRQIQSGELVINLSSITEQDADPEQADKLIGHLKSADFFNVEKFPTAKVVVFQVKDGEVTADLTIKSKTKTIQFPADIGINEGQLQVVAKFPIDRTDWGIVYKSGNFFTDLAKDKIISDEINFEIDIQATK